MRRAVMFGLALAFVAAAPAQADQTIMGRDSLDWDRPNIAITPGETVTWTFDGTQQAHNVQPADGEAWMAPSPLGVPAAPWSHKFETEGVYNFLCQVHRDTMRGTVTVSAVPVEATPTPTPPPSQQPYANDDTTVIVNETVAMDTARPRLTSVSAKRVARGTARVRFRVSELSTVSVRFKRGGRTVRTVASVAEGLRGVNVRMRRGSYSVEVRATDVAGNRSVIKRVRVRVR